MSFPNSSPSATAAPPTRGAKLIVRTVDDAIAKGIWPSRARRDQPQQAANPRAPRRHRGIPFRLLHRRRPARRGKSPRQGTLLQLPRQPSANGTPKNQRPESGTFTTPASIPAKTCACSRSPTGPRWTSGNTSSSEQLEVPSIYFSHERECFRRQRPVAPRRPHRPQETLIPTPARAPNPTSRTLVVRVRTIADMISTGMIESPADSVDDIITESPPPASPNAAPAPTTRPPKPRWRTARRRDISEPPNANSRIENLVD
jgi:sulfate adenylyltransferase subunit 2